MFGSTRLAAYNSSLGGVRSVLAAAIDKTVGAWHMCRDFDVSKAEKTMTTAQLHDLETRVMQILERAQKPLTIPEIERELRSHFQADTFDVRDAVWRLIAERRAEFTPRRHVRASHRS